MKFLKIAMLMALALTILVPASAAVIIDPYTDGQFNGQLGAGAFNYAPVNLGLFTRVIGVTQSGSDVNTSILANAGSLSLNAGTFTSADWIVTYSGGPLNLLANNGFLFSAASELGYTLGFQVNGQTSSTSIVVPGGNVLGNYGVGFASFGVVDWANVSSIVITANSAAAGSDLILKPMEAGIPEPSTYALMGAGLLALAGLARRRKA